MDADCASTVYGIWSCSPWSRRRPLYPASSRLWSRSGSDREQQQQSTADGSVLRLQSSIRLWQRPQSWKPQESHGRWNWFPWRKRLWKWWPAIRWNFGMVPEKVESDSRPERHLGRGNRQQPGEALFLWRTSAEVVVVRASRTELLPEDWLPQTTICGRGKTASRPHLRIWAIVSSTSLCPSDWNPSSDSVRCIVDPKSRRATSGSGLNSDMLGLFCAVNNRVTIRTFQISNPKSISTSSGFNIWR